MDLPLNIAVPRDLPKEVQGHYTTTQTENKQLCFCQHVAVTCLVIGLQHLNHSVCCPGFRNVREQPFFENSWPCTVRPPE